MQTRTRRQKEVLGYITRFIENHGFEPSYQQIAMSLGIASKGVIAKHIEALEKQGLITRRRENGVFKLELHSANSIADFVCEIEWLQLSNHMIVNENRENDPLFVPKSLLNNHLPENLRAFRAPNDAMLESHICEGDIVLIEKKAFARDGEIVVAVPENNSPVLKKFFRQGAKVELRPANPHYVSIILPADKVKVCGILRGILRPLD